MNFTINGQERRLRNISYHTDHDLYATYKGYDLQVAEQETGGFYATVKDPKGNKVIDQHVRGLYLPEAVKEVMKDICFKISSKNAEMKKRATKQQCNIPFVSHSDFIKYCELVLAFLKDKQCCQVPTKIAMKVAAEIEHKGVSFSFKKSNKYNWTTFHYLYCHCG